jgi:hypothetical protein
LRHISTVAFSKARGFRVIVEADPSVVAKERKVMSIFCAGHFTFPTYWKNKVPSYFSYCSRSMGFVKYLPILPARKLKFL